MSVWPFSAMKTQLTVACQQQLIFVASAD